MSESPQPPPEQREFTAADIGALAHLYRAEVYRSTVWRTRLDTTTNWAVVTLGIALSITYSSAGASPMPLVLVGILIIFFLMLEARRYRYFHVWRARARYLENHLYVPMLDDSMNSQPNWRQVLAQDYWHPHYHVGMLMAMGRRIRGNYLWILAVQTIAYLGKLMVHPYPAPTLDVFLLRGTVGPVPGKIMILLGAIYLFSWVGIASWSLLVDRARIRARRREAGRPMG